MNVEMAKEVQTQQAFDRTLRGEVVADHLHVLDGLPEAGDGSDRHRTVNCVANSRPLAVTISTRLVAAAGS